MKNLKIRKKNKKLYYVKVELFFIKAKKRSVSYELKLPDDTKIYPVFHVFLLELANLEISIQDTFHY